MRPGRIGSRYVRRAARSPGMAGAQRMFDAHAESERRGIPVEEILGAGDTRLDGSAGRQGTHTRRELLGAGAMLAGGVIAATTPARALARAISPRSRTAPRIVVVGAGLAGLRCAHELWTGSPRGPLAATVYEANVDRAGGRCWTLRDYFAAGLITEHGGSFINSNQLSVRALAARLGLEEEVVDGGDLPTGSEVFWIGGAYYTEDEANRDWSELGYPAFRAARHMLRTSAGEEALDSMSVPEWLDSTEIGSHSRFGKLMMANTVTENGGDPSDQSALDLIELTTGKPRAALVPLPGDDERHHIVGGNDRLVSGMISQLPEEAVVHGHELVALRANADRTSTLTFAVGASSAEVTADLVVLALPFSKLRDVDLSKSGLSATKRKVIRTLGMGSNAKLHLELSRKTWPSHGFSGATYGEWDRFCCAWDDSVPLGPDAGPALFLGFPGGRVGRSVLSGAAHAAAPAADVAWLLDQIEHVFPGTAAAYTGRAYEDHWAIDPWVQGAYSFYRVGQASAYGALAAATEERIHFAGEHTSIANQGFLEGAVESGERAARQILSRLR
jgi:monoamine oxidase